MLRVKSKFNRFLMFRVTYVDINRDRFQKLELAHVPDRGAFAAIEMR